MKQSTLILLIASTFLFTMIGCKAMVKRTKEDSPETRFSYTLEEEPEASFQVYYNRPSKRGRVIFGDLVPYNEVWRTGANEPTTFETDEDLNIAEQTLPEGKYTLWTIPGPAQWTVIFNSEMYRWGIKLNGEPAREQQYDVVTVQVPVNRLTEPVEMFTIDLRGRDAVELVLSWDRTQVVVPMFVQ